MRGNPAVLIEAATLLVFGLVWLALVAILRLKGRKSFVYLGFFTLFYVYLFKVLDYTVLQYQSLTVLKYLMPDLILNGQADGEGLNLVPLATLTSTDLGTSLLNVLLLVPLGFGLPFITSLRVGRVVFAGFLFSILIELLQLSTGLLAGITFRVADVNDVIFNTAGAALGYVLFAGFTRLYRRLAQAGRIGTDPVSRHIIERPQLAARE